MPHPAAPSAPVSERLHGLDALRGFALLLGVALHAAMAWMPGAQYFWITHDADPSEALSGLFWWIHSFRMTTFFLLAGFFACLLCERVGPRAFALDRWRRVGRPLLALWPLLFTGIVIAVVWGAWLKGGGSLPAESPPGPKFTPDDFPLTHLWFLYVLSLFYIVTLALRTVILQLDPRGRLSTACDALFDRLMGPWAPLLLAVPVAVALMTQVDWYAWFGVPTPDQSLYPNLSAVIGFGTAFAVGWWLQRKHPLLDRIATGVWLNLGLALITSVLCLSIVGIAPPLAPATQDATTLLYAWSYGVAGWSWTLALTGLALRYCSDHSALRRYLADASYWVYLVHLPVVMALQVAATQFEGPWWVEFPSVLMLGLALMFGSYHGMVRNTALGAWLNGQKRVADNAVYRTPMSAASLQAPHPEATNRLGV